MQMLFSHSLRLPAPTAPPARKRVTVPVALSSASIWQASSSGSSSSTGLHSAAASLPLLAPLRDNAVQRRASSRLLVRAQGSNGDGGLDDLVLVTVDSLRNNGPGSVIYLALQGSGSRVLPVHIGAWSVQCAGALGKADSRFCGRSDRQGFF